MDAKPTPSPALLAANQRLEEVRKEWAARKEQAAAVGRQSSAVNYQSSAASYQPTAARDRPATNGNSPVDFSGPTVDFSCLPPHLGWGSAPLTAGLRRAQVTRDREATAVAEPAFVEQCRQQVEVTAVGQKGETAVKPVPDEKEKDGRNSGGNGDSGGGAAPAGSDKPGVKCYPDLNLAALKAGEAALYRIWLLARHCDTTGQGWLATAVFKQALTGPHSAGRVCSRQRLNQILNEGCGRYWTFERDGARLRYTGAAALAASLQVERLSGSPVYLPIRIIVGQMGKLKAALYAAWHAGRGQAGQPRPAPISRAALAGKSGVSARTLQRYDQRAGVERRRHVAVGGRYNEKAAQEHAWQRGRAAFTFTDYQGRQGRAGGVYLAHNLPNSYEANLVRAARGRQRKINRRLTQPRDHVARGAGAARIFHPDGAAAGKAYNRQPDNDAYWPMKKVGFDGRVWAIIPAVVK
jgi:hypothetical protein